jgi:hypothetical protein
MRLVVDPSPLLDCFAEDLALVIDIRVDQPPELYLSEELSKPDRHFLLGLVQTVAIAIEEKDQETVAFMDACTVRLEMAGQVKELHPELIVLRSTEGRIGVLAVGDVHEARRLARHAVRWFTGAIRLDVP